MMKKMFGCRAMLIVTGLFPSVCPVVCQTVPETVPEPEMPNYSSLVYPGADGKLVYKPQGSGAATKPQAAGVSIH